MKKFFSENIRYILITGLVIVLFALYIGVEVNGIRLDLMEKYVSNRQEYHEIYIDTKKKHNIEIFIYDILKPGSPSTELPLKNNHENKLMDFYINPPDKK